MQRARGPEKPILHNQEVKTDRKKKKGMGSGIPRVQRKVGAGSAKAGEWGQNNNKGMGVTRIVKTYQSVTDAGLPEFCVILNLLQFWHFPSGSWP